MLTGRAVADILIHRLTFTMGGKVIVQSDLFLLRPYAPTGATRHDDDLTFTMGGNISPGGVLRYITDGDVQMK